MSELLRPAVLEAIRAGTFHLWPVRSVDEAVELLTGVAAGERDGHGRWPELSVNWRVDSRLARFTETMVRLVPRRRGAPEG